MVTNGIIIIMKSISYPLCINSKLNKSYFEDNYCTIYDKKETTQILAKLKMVSRCFPLDIKCVENVALIINKTDLSWLWHKRLGHLNFGAIKLLH